MKTNHLILLFLFLMCGVAAAQQTNPPVLLPGGKTFDETLAKATNGDVDSEFYLGIYYLPGSAGSNFVEALKWISKAAADGEDQAQAMLGTFYQHGTAGAVAKDNNKAAYWFLRAAKQGDNQSQIDIAWMYYNGEGVIQDYVEAYNSPLKNG